MTPFLKSFYKGVIKSILLILMLLLLLAVSFFTPVFSSVGLWVLNHLPIPEVTHYPISFVDNITDNSQAETKQSYSKLVLNLRTEHRPTAYVVLGGGLTEADHTYHSNRTSSDSMSSDDTSMSNHKKTIIDHKLNAQSDSQLVQNSDEPNIIAEQINNSLAANNIVLNKYSLNRMITVIRHYKRMPLPIVLTGVEAAWMQDWLYSYGIYNVITENASMNTCENARFTAKRLNLSDVYLITDAYHMTRTRRQFALNHIHTTPIPSPLPMQKGWLSPKNNAQHSRRALYEILAYTRDVFAPQRNCRDAREVSFDTLLRSRKPADS